MTGLQKFIKYAAIAFGIYLSITIVFVILELARGFVGGSKTGDKGLIEHKNGYTVEDISKEYNNVKKLEIDLESTKLVIKNGDKLKVEGTNIPEKMEIQQDGETLKIDDEKTSHNSSGDKIITIYLPENEKLDTINIETKYESIDAEKLNATNLKLDTSSNDCKIDELVSDNLEIDNEYANIDIYNCEAKVFKFDSESGAENINIKVVESANIEIKYSDTNINFIGKQDDYQINNKNNFGTTYIEGEEMTADNQTIGSGNAKIDLNIKSSDIYINFDETANEIYL